MPEGDIDIVGNTVGSFAFGTLFGAAKEAWRFGPSEAKGLATRIPYAELAHNVGKSSLQFAVVGGLYSVGAVVAKGARDKDDSLNFGFGGALAGAFLGMRSKSLHSVILKSITLAGAGVLCSFVSGKLSGNPRAADTELAQRFAYISAADSAKK